MVTRNDIISHMGSNHFQPKGQLSVATAPKVAVCLIKTNFIYEGYKLKFPQYSDKSKFPVKCNIQTLNLSDCKGSQLKLYPIKFTINDLLSSPKTIEM